MRARDSPWAFHTHEGGDSPGVIIAGIKVEERAWVMRARDSP